MSKDFESARVDKMVEVLNDLDDSDLLSLFRDVNSYDGNYGFVDGFYMSEFLSLMVEGKNGSELVDFIMDVARAIDDYKGYDGIENALWGYPDMYGLEIRDESDIAEQGREDYIEDLASDIIEDGRTNRFGRLPSEVEELLDTFDSEDNIGWIGAGTYCAYDKDGNEVDCKHFDDFDSYYEWTEDERFWEFDCPETD